VTHLIAIQQATTPRGEKRTIRTQRDTFDCSCGARESTGETVPGGDVPQHDRLIPTACHQSFAINVERYLIIRPRIVAYQRGPEPLAPRYVPQANGVIQGSASRGQEAPIRAKCQALYLVGMPHEWSPKRLARGNIPELDALCTPRGK
jgi:hypothetical protein